MAIVQQNFAAYLHTLRIVFLALLTGQVMVLVVLYAVRWQQMPVSVSSLDPWVLQLLPVLLLIFAVPGLFLYRKKLTNARLQPDLKAKLVMYRGALLLHWAAMECVVLLIGVSYFLTGGLTLLYAAILLLAIFATQRPTRNGIVTSLELSTDEQLALDDPNAIVSQISQRPG